MHVDKDRLKGKIVAHGLTKKRVSAQIGVDCSTFFEKSK